MKKGIIILLTVFLTSGFAQDNSFKPKYSTILDSRKGETLLRQCSRGTPKDISDYWTLTEKEIQKLEIKFKKVLKLKASSGQTISSLDKFGFQYIGVTIKTKRFIYLNAFHINSDDDFNTFYRNWTTDPVVMCDGGDHYWGVLFDLEKLKFRDLEINGLI